MKKRVLLIIMCVFAFTANAQITSVAIVGAGAGGWPSDNSCGGPIDQNQMVKVDAENWILENVVISGPNFKFRANNCWNVATDTPEGRNIGAPATGTHFPSATGTDSGGSQPISAGVIPGTYTVKLNTTTLAYSFEGGAVVPVVKLVGTAVDGGSVDIIATSATTFEATVTLLTGNAKFDVDGVLISDDKLVGNAFEGGPAIPVTAGKWLIKLNVETGDYSFEVAPFIIVGITGAAGPGWGNDYEFTTTDGINYTLLGGVFVEGGMLFRLNKSYDSKFGGEAVGLDIFASPSGALSAGGNDIIIGAGSVGTYDITFNLETLEYTTTPSLSTKGFSSLNFKVYPNPATNNWNFTSTKERIETIQVLDVLGKNVMTIFPKSNTVNVDASSLTKGIYFAKVATAKATETLKLMKN